MMHRRTILTAVPALLAGCLGAGNHSDGPTSTSTTRTPTDTTTTPTANTTAQLYDLIPVDAESMTVDEVRERLGDRDCSTLADLSVTCPDDDGPLRVSVSPAVGDLSGGTVEFTVENGSDEQFMTNHYRWLLGKWDGSRWRHVAPLAVPAPLDSIPPDESHTYRISPVEGEITRDRDAYVTESEVTLGGLGPGVYGFSARGHFESAPDDDLAVAAVFGFAGEGLAIRPTDDVTRVEYDGSELIVHADAPNDERGELVVSLVGGAPETQLLPEHVRQLAALLNTLSYAATDGVETIRYVGNTDDVGMVDTYLAAVTAKDTTRYGFRDYVFEVSVEEA